MAGQHTFKIDAGSTWTRNLIWYDSQGDVVDITGYTATMRLSRERGGSLEYELTTSNGRISITGAEGKVTLSLTDEETATLSDNYVYDLILSNGGVDTRLIDGTINVSAQAAP